MSQQQHCKSTLERAFASADSGQVFHSAVRAGGCATPTGFAARAGAEAAHALTFKSNHPMGADHIAPPTDNPMSSKSSKSLALNPCCATNKAAHPFHPTSGRPVVA